MSARRRLKFSDTEEAAAEVRRLRSGCTQAGKWNLAQTCWHLNKAVRFSMEPVTGAAPSVLKLAAQRVIARVILTTGRMPAGVSGPERIMPPADVGESAVDDFLAALVEVKNFEGEFGVHPRLGRLSRDEYVRLHLIHSAHHLGFLTPADVRN